MDLSLTEILVEKSKAASNALATGREKSIATFVRYNDLDQAIADLKRDHITACYLIEADYLSSGKVVAYTKEGGLFSNIVAPGSNQLYDLLSIWAIVVKAAMVEVR